MDIDGKLIAKEIRSEIAEEIARDQIDAHLAVILVGNDPASSTYVRAKTRACKEVGMRSTLIHLPEETTQEALLALVKELEDDPSVHGILVQLPLPDHINENTIIDAIPPAKDVDGFHPLNAGALVLGRRCFIPCTPLGVLELLKRHKVEVAGKHVVIVGRGNITGRPLSELLSKNIPGGNATVTLCHSYTKNLFELVAQADILVSAVGKANFIPGTAIKEGAIVIDVGFSKVEDPSKKAGYHLTGDVEYDIAKERASLITPVPGGVGPMTIAMLLSNTLAAAKQKLPKAPAYIKQ